MGLKSFLRKVFANKTNENAGGVQKSRDSKIFSDSRKSLHATPVPNDICRDRKELFLLMETPEERYSRLQRAIIKIHCPSGRTAPTQENELCNSPYQEISAKVNAAKNTRLAEKALFHWGQINACQATAILENQRVGTFLLRTSSDSKYLFSLSVKYDAIRVGHVRILYRDGLFTFFCHMMKRLQSDNVLDLIGQAVSLSRQGHPVLLYQSPTTDTLNKVFLLYPLERRPEEVPSLKQLCQLKLLEYRRRNSNCC